MLEREVLHVAVDGEELPSGEHGQLDVEDAVLGTRVLDYEKETEVPGVSGPQHGLHHLLPALVEDTPAVSHDDQQLADCEVPAGRGALPPEHLGGEMRQVGVY